MGVEYKEAGSRVAECSSAVPAFQCWKWYLRFFINLVLCLLTSPPLQNYQKSSMSHSLKEVADVARTSSSRMASGLPLIPAYAGSSPGAVGVFAAETLLLESDVCSLSCFLWRKPQGRLL